MRSVRFAVGIIGMWGLLHIGCNAFDERDGPALQPTIVPDGEGFAGFGGATFVPVDERQAIRSEIAPLPVSGGTLLATSNGASIIASDPERDIVSIVSITNVLDLRLEHTVTLEAGDQPGRAVEDMSGRVHVALRRGGSVVTIDVATGAVLQRRAVCKAPRGIAFESTTGLLHVACAEGKLVSLSTDGGEVLRGIALPPDLRDVIVRGSELWVTRFKSAEVLRIDAQGALVQTVGLSDRSGALLRQDPQLGSVEQPVTLQPEIAWRAMATSNGGIVVVHQDAVEEEIEITPATQSGGSAYGGGGAFSCNSVVQNGVSVIAADGTVTSRRGFVGAPLPVDVALSPDAQQIAIAHAGLHDPGAPFVQSPTANFGVTLLPANGTSEPCVLSNLGYLTDAPVVAVAFTPNGLLVGQIREPSKLFVTDGVSLGGVVLPGDSRLDTGHEIFHRDSGAGIACASCHPEGGEDGHVWHFSGVGERRTQALHVGLGATAPFHWNGDLADVGALMTEVFVGRMGGVNESPERLDALTTWLFGLERPPAIRDATDDAALRGDTLFHSQSTGCSECHAGDHLTNNVNAWVGTTAADAPIQVPSLVAVGYRAPFMHNGCATTLAQRFDPGCGGTEHGHTSQLTLSEIADLVAYLESL